MSPRRQSRGDRTVSRSVGDEIASASLCRASGRIWVEHSTRGTPRRLGCLRADCRSGRPAARRSRRRQPRTISLHHVHTGEDLTITYKKNGQYDEDALKKINWVLRDWRKNEATTMDPQGDRSALGGLSGGRRQGADLYRLRLPLARDQRNASQPQPPFRRGALQPAHARQGHRFLYSRRAARQAPRHRDEAAGRRRRLLSDIGLAVRASRRRQRPRLAAHDARAARQAVPRRPHRAPPA